MTGVTREQLEAMAARAPSRKEQQMFDEPRRKYLCRPDWWTGDDWNTVEAATPKEAAERYAESHDHNGAEYPDEQEIHVLVEGEVLAFTVYAEAVRLYHAKQRSQTK